MKKYLFVLCMCVLAILSSCGLSTSDIERETKKLMVEKFQEDGQKLVISEFTLIHESGNNYRGLANCTLDGEKIQLDVSVLCDGENIQAEWAPSAEYQQKVLNQAMEEAEREGEKIQKEAEEAIERINKIQEGVDYNEDW